MSLYFEDIHAHSHISYMHRRYTQTRFLDQLRRIVGKFRSLPFNFSYTDIFYNSLQFYIFLYLYYFLHSNLFSLACFLTTTFKHLTEIIILMTGRKYCDRGRKSSNRKLQEQPIDKSTVKYALSLYFGLKINC